MAQLTAEKREELKTKHKRVYLYQDEEAGDFVFTTATQDVWDEFIDSVQSDNTSAPTRTLIDNCVVFPEMGELQQVHKEYPALADTLARMIREKSGGRKNAEAKKL